MRDLLWLRCPMMAARSSDRKCQIVTNKKKKKKKKKGFVFVSLTRHDASCRELLSVATAVVGINSMLSIRNRITVLIGTQTRRVHKALRLQGIIQCRKSVSCSISLEPSTTTTASNSSSNIYKY
jgi:hypothetical protein